MKALYLTREEAEREIKATGKSYSVSSADESSIERTYCDICWSGEVQCFRTDDNEDACAWWYDVTEEEINKCMGAMFQGGSDPDLCDTREKAARLASFISDTPTDNVITPDDVDEEEWNIYKAQLGLADYEVRVIHWGINGSAYSYCLASDWDYIG